MERLSSHVILEYAQRQAENVWEEMRWPIMGQLGLFDYMVGTSFKTWCREPLCDLCGGECYAESQDDGIHREWICMQCRTTWIQHRRSGKILY